MFMDLSSEMVLALLPVHPDQLIRYNLTLNEVLTAAKKATGVRGAGFSETTNQRIVFQTEGQSLKADPRFA